MFRIHLRPAVPWPDARSVSASKRITIDDTIGSDRRRNGFRVRCRRQSVLEWIGDVARTRKDENGYGLTVSCDGEVSEQNKTEGAVERRRILLNGVSSLSSFVFLLDSAFEPAYAHASASTSNISRNKDDMTKGRVRQARMVIRVAALRGSIPQQLIADFQTAMEGYGSASITQRPHLKDIWEDLTAPVSSGKATTADMATMTDSWMQSAIRKGIIQPIPDARNHRFWDSLSPRLKELVTRNPTTGRADPNGEIFGCPYRWGTTLILYRTDRMNRWGGEPIADWDDLLKPSLKGRIGFFDSPREFVGIALKTLGLQYNSTVEDMNACGVDEDMLMTRIQRLASQVRVFSNENHVRAFSAGEIDLIVGWSDDILPLAQRISRTKVVAPSSGTALWADVWTVPKNAAGGFEDGEPSPLVSVWLDMFMQPVYARRSQGIRNGASPLLLPDGGTTSYRACSPLRSGSRVGSFPESEVAQENMLLSSELIDGLMPTEIVLKKSEFLLPLEEKTLHMYQRVLSQKNV